MKRSEIFAFMPVGVVSVIETDRTDRQFVTQTNSERVTHVIETRMFRSGQKISRVEKCCALELSIDGERVLDIEDGVELASNRIALWIVRTKRSFAETADAGR